MQPQISRKVFLSHTKADKDFARRLATDVESFGFEAWFDEWELRVGDSLIGKVEEGIQESQWMIVILSEAALGSEWVLKELRSGLARELGSTRVFVLPALREPVKLPAFLADKFYADFTGSYESGLKLIRDRLVGSYQSASSDHWLLVRNPMPKAVRESLLTLSANNLRTSLSLLRLGYQSSRLYVPNPKQVFQLAGRVPTPTSSGAGESELWFGRTGRLVLRRDGDRVSGDYDWHGMSLVGGIEGRREGTFVVFAWDWSISSERGRGFFSTAVPNVLHGGWWMDYDDIDEDAVRSGRATVPNTWEFVNVQGLFIESGGESQQD